MSRWQGPRGDPIIERPGTGVSESETVAQHTGLIDILSRNTTFAGSPLASGSKVRFVARVCRSNSRLSTDKLYPSCKSLSDLWDVCTGIRALRSFQKLMPVTVGILQCNPIQSAISQNLIGQIFGTE